MQLNLNIGFLKTTKSATISKKCVFTKKLKLQLSLKIGFLQQQQKHQMLLYYPKCEKENFLFEQLNLIFYAF